MPLAASVACLFWQPVPDLAVVALFFILALVLIFIAWFWYSFLRAWWLWEKDAMRRAGGHRSSTPIRRLLQRVYEFAAAAAAVPIMTRARQWRLVGTEAIAAVYLSRDVPFWRRFGPIIMAFIFFVMGVKNVAGLPSWGFFCFAISGLVFYPFELRSFIHERSKERLAAGLCPCCGYDLCATPEKCPECGAAPTKTEPQTRPAGPA